MAYLIGNTTVIDNNGALGAVSGNSLNLANNNNIDAGGGGVKSITSSSNFADSTIGSTGAIAVCVGGGGGSSGSNNEGWGQGGTGGTVIHAFALGAGNNLTCTVGGRGNNIGTSNNFAPSGGSTSISYTNVQSHTAGGGNGGRRLSGSSSHGNAGAGLVGDGNFDDNVGFNNIGKGSSNGSTAGTGYVGLLGL